MTIRNDFRVEPADYQVDFADLRAVREPVFVVEQNVPIEEEWDELDPQCIHVIARDAENRPIGTGRLTPMHTLGRMAVLREWRGKGVGEALMVALLDLAQQRGWPEISLHSQTHAMPFYAKFGFEAEGEEYMEAGIPHRTMRLTLPARIEGREPAATPTGDAVLIDLNSESQLLDLTTNVASRARRELRVFTRDLEHGLYANKAVMEALRAFATSGRQPQLRVLVVEPERLLHDTHPLVELAQRLPSVIALRTPLDPEDRQAADAWLVNDVGGYVYRALATRFEGNACLAGRARARQLQEEFDRRWERARPLTELRALGA